MKDKGREGKKGECVGTKGSVGTNDECRNKAVRGTKEEWRTKWELRTKRGVEDQKGGKRNKKGDEGTNRGFEKKWGRRNKKGNGGTIRGTEEQK